MNRPTPDALRAAIRYAAGVTVAHILAVTEVVFVLTALGRETTGAAAGIYSGRTPAVIAVVAAAAIIAVAVGSTLAVLPSMRWFVTGQTPTARQRERALAIPRRQSVLVASVWALSGIVVVVANLPATLPAVVLIVPTVFFGATAAVLTALLLTVRSLRPLTSAAAPTTATRDTAPGVLARLFAVWVLCSALPSAGVALLILLRANGWIIERTASLELPVLALLAVAVVWGLRAMILVARSISDPVGDVVDAMADVEHGNLGHTVDVYEQSEIGRLQAGFNAMVAGLRERDRLRDLFGRNVGDDVVRLLEDRDDAMYRDVRDVAVLFVDLAGSTQLAANHPPQEVADVLNEFFGLAVAAVDRHHGFVNKFQGDAVLAIFGAPVRRQGAVSDALAAARDLGEQMRRLRAVDFGIGVAAGTVFAGFIGAVNRFEYTVIGDPVNEAARLADRAKIEPGRILCSGNAIEGADGDERPRWVASGSVMLRGRAATTELFAPAG